MRYSQEFIFLTQVESTQDEVRSRLSQVKSPTETLWVLAGHQTKGRGRQGRQWFSNDPENLMLSAGFQWNLNSAQKPLVSLLAGVAASEALLSFGDLPEGSKFFLKWPNDLFVRRVVSCSTENKSTNKTEVQATVQATVQTDPCFEYRKIGGILAESFREGLVVGWGINLRHSPAEVSRSSSYAQEWNRQSPQAVELAHRIAHLFCEKLSCWSEKPTIFPEQLLESCAQLMQPLWGLSGTVQLSAASNNLSPGAGTSSDKRQKAVAQGLNLQNGALIIELEDGSVAQVNAGEFSFDTLSTT